MFTTRLIQILLVFILVAPSILVTPLLLAVVLMFRYRAKALKRDLAPDNKAASKRKFRILIFLVSLLLFAALHTGHQHFVVEGCEFRRMRLFPLQFQSGGISLAGLRMLFQACH